MRAQYLWETHPIWWCADAGRQGGRVRPLWRGLVRVLLLARASADWDGGAIFVYAMTRKSRRLRPPPLKNSANSLQLVLNWLPERWSTRPGVTIKKGAGGVWDVGTVHHVISHEENWGSGAWHGGSVRTIFGWGSSDYSEKGVRLRRPPPALYPLLYEHWRTLVPPRSVSYSALFSFAVLFLWLNAFQRNITHIIIIRYLCERLINCRTSNV